MLSRATLLFLQVMQAPGGHRSLCDFILGHSVRMLYPPQQLSRIDEKQNQNITSIR